MKIMQASNDTEERARVRCGAPVRRCVQCDKTVAGDLDFCPKCTSSAIDENSTCRRTAGDRTEHQGTGPCFLHGGSTGNHGQAARRKMAGRIVEQRALPRSIDPQQALLEAVHHTTGTVDFLERIVAALDVDELVQVDAGGKFERPAVWVEMLSDARRLQLQACRDAIAGGVREREIRLMEEQGRLLGVFVVGLLRRLGLEGDPVAVAAAQAELLALDVQSREKP